MLVISRRKGQRITIGDEIEIVVTELHRSSVKLGIKAPREYAVLRGEIHDSIEEANRAAAETVLEIDLVFEEGTSQGSALASKPASLLSIRQSTGGGERQNEDGEASETPVVVRRRAHRMATPTPPDSDPAEVV